MPVTHAPQSYTATIDAPAGMRAVVVPSTFTVDPGGSVDIQVRLDAGRLHPGQYFATLNLIGGPVDPHLPIAFRPVSPDHDYVHQCTEDGLVVDDPSSNTDCTVEIRNQAPHDVTVTARTTVNGRMRITGATGADQVRGTRVAAPRTVLAARDTGSAAVLAGGLFGYVPLDALGVAFTPTGDDDQFVFGTPPYEFAGQTFNELSVTSNGYVLVGGAGVVSFVPQAFPNPAQPNGVIAPFWADLDGTEPDSEGFAIAVVTDGSNSWIVVEWRLKLFQAGITDNQLRVFQTWIGTNGTEDITFAYDPDNLPLAPPAPRGLTVGAEDPEGEFGAQITGAPTEDLRVTTTPGTPGGTLTYAYTAEGVREGPGFATRRVDVPELFRGSFLDHGHFDILATAPPPANGPATAGGPRDDA